MKKESAVRYGAAQWAIIDRPVSFFNLGKKSEYYSRKSFSEKVCLANKKFTEQYS